MPIRPEVLPFLPAAVALGLLAAGAAALVLRRRRPACATGIVTTLLVAAGLLFFFRDPARTPPADPALIVSGADGVVAQIAAEGTNALLHAPAVRVSIFLGLQDVHVNRAPIAGTVRLQRHTPGGKQPAWRAEASFANERNTILIDGAATRCVVVQICGMAARRVVSWLRTGQEIGKGDRIGMMKFGSRLDMVFPRADVVLRVAEGDRVRAGETVVAVLRETPDS
jgi:phosphatidylserine decarboxylase